MNGKMRFITAKIQKVEKPKVVLLLTKKYQMAINYTSTAKLLKIWLAKGITKMNLKNL
jgi:hypothetical protein